MVTKATRDVIDLQIRPVVGGLLVEGDGSANFSINGTSIGDVLPSTAIFSQVSISVGGDIIIDGGEINVNGTIKGRKGNELVPGFSFGGGTGDPSATASGFYAIGSGDTVTEVAVSVNGTPHTKFKTNEIKVENGFPLRVSNGNSNTPSIASGDDLNTGIYWPPGNTNETKFTNVGANTWTIASNGDLLVGDGIPAGINRIGSSAKRVGTIFAQTVDAVNLSTSGVGQFEINAGTEAAPGLTFVGDTNTGIYAPTVNSLAITVAGSLAARFDSGSIGLEPGLISSPSIVNNNKFTQGIYFKSLDAIAFANNNADSLVSTLDQLRIPNGSAGVPSLSSLSDTDTGIFFSGSGTIEFSINSDRKWRITSAGHLIPKGATGNNSDNEGVLDIGSNTERVRTLFAKTINTPQDLGSDLAEGFFNEYSQNITPGDVVILSGKDQSCMLSSKSCDSKVIGVVTDTAVFLMNYDTENTNMLPIALAGVVNVKCEGTIKPGDHLVSSNLPGHARKARWWERILKPHAVLGKALSPPSGTRVKIKIT